MTYHIIKLQDYMDGVDPDKTQRYDTLYKALLKHDGDFRFMNEVMGEAWIREHYSTKQLTELWETAMCQNYLIPIAKFL